MSRVNPLYRQLQALRLARATAAAAPKGADAPATLRIDSAKGKAAVAVPANPTLQLVAGTKASAGTKGRAASQLPPRLDAKADAQQALAALFDGHRDVETRAHPLAAFLHRYAADTGALRALILPTDAQTSPLLELVMRLRKEPSQTNLAAMEHLFAPLLQAVAYLANAAGDALDVAAKAPSGPLGAATAPTIAAAATAAEALANQIDALLLDTHTALLLCRRTLAQHAAALPPLLQSGAFLAAPLDALVRLEAHQHMRLWGAGHMRVFAGDEDLGLPPPPLGEAMQLAAELFSPTLPPSITRTPQGAAEMPQFAQLADTELLLGNAMALYALASRVHLPLDLSALILPTDAVSTDDMLGALRAAALRSAIQIDHAKASAPMRDLADFCDRLLDLPSEADRKSLLLREGL